mgnify:CR=1 FL=1|jgi:large subunit ribosomal protein L10
MTRAEKEAFVAELQAKLAQTQAVYLTDFTGMSVKEMTEFRNRLRRAGVEYLVVKNTLARRAWSQAHLPDVDGHLEGPTGLVLERRDPVSAAKVLAEFAREFQKPRIKIGIVDRRTVEPADIQRLATLPPREVLLAQLAGALQAPLARLAGGMHEILARFARVVDALRQARESAGA